MKEQMKDMYINEKRALRYIAKVFKKSYKHVQQIALEMNFPMRSFQEQMKCIPSRKHSEETKKSLSEKRKKFLKENPDKHPWRRSTKFTSIPCENLKKMLKDSGYVFETEFCPPEIDRSYSLDIAFTDRKLAIEVNGNQHYNRDGTLKDYYKERHAILEQHGWTILEIHYSTCFSESSMEMIRTFI